MELLVANFASDNAVVSCSEHPVRRVRISAPKDSEVEPRLLVEIFALEKDKLINRRTGLINAELHALWDHLKPMLKKWLGKVSIG